MHWTWDPGKNGENQRKHHVRFEIAQMVFNDPYFTTEEDFYPGEQRWRTTGTVGQTVLIVVHTLPPTEEGPGRIISARRADPHERKRYEEGNGQTD